LKQYEVALEAKLSRAMLSGYEIGKSYPSVPTLQAILQALGADFCDLQRSINADIQGVSFRFKDDPEHVEREAGRAVMALVDCLRQNEREEAMPKPATE
jgi:transcriptional regulator with XRE-family HTH domain